MARTMKLAAVLITAATGVMAVLYRETAGDVWLTLAITCGIIAHHMVMKRITAGASCGCAVGENVIA